VWVEEDTHSCIPKARADELQLPAELVRHDFVSCPLIESGHECGPKKNARDHDTSTPRCDDKDKKCCVSKNKEGQEKYECWRPQRGCKAGEVAKPEYDWAKSEVGCNAAKKCTGMGAVASGELCCADANPPTKSECKSYPTTCGGDKPVNICGGNSMAPCVEADYSHVRVNPAVAGVSMGSENCGAAFYWTLGAVLCKKGSPDRYGLTNWHNFLPNGQNNPAGLGAPMPKMNSEKKKVYQPSKNGKDTGAEHIAEFADWKYYSNANPAYDVALLKFTDPAKADFKVLTPHGAKPVLGSLTKDQVKALKTTDLLYLAGRTSGWMVFKFKSFHEGHNMVIGNIASYEAGSFNPEVKAGGIGMPGNSGSGLYMKDAKQDAYWLVAIFDGEAPGDEAHFNAVYEILARIKTDTGLELSADCAAQAGLAAVVQSIKSKGESIKSVLSPAKK